MPPPQGLKCIFLKNLTIGCRFIPTRQSTAIQFRYPKMFNTSLIRRYRIIPLLVTLALLNGAIWALLPRYRFNAIVLHHSASWQDNYESIRNFHRARAPNIRDAAYHLILSNGSTKVPLGHLEATGRYRNLSYSMATRNRSANLRALHICVIGNYDQRTVPEDLQPVIGSVLQALSRRFSIARENIRFHRDVSPSACPGRYITREKINLWIDQKAATCPPAIRAQHSKVIADFAMWPRALRIQAALAALSVGVVVLWLSISFLLNRRRFKPAAKTSFR